MKIYSTRDIVAKSFSSLVCLENDATAIRSFQDGMKGNRFFSDYELCLLGEIDMTTGYISSVDPIVIFPVSGVSNE